VGQLALATIWAAIASVSISHMLAASTLMSKHGGGMVKSWGAWVVGVGLLVLGCWCWVVG